MHKIQISQLKPQKITPMAAAGLLGPDLLAKHSKLQLSIVIKIVIVIVKLNARVQLTSGSRYHKHEQPVGDVLPGIRQQ